MIPKLAVKLPGNETNANHLLGEFSHFLWRRPDYLTIFTSDEHWSNAQGEFIAAGYFLGKNRYGGIDLPAVDGTTCPLLITIPLCPNDRTSTNHLPSVFNGARDGEFRRA